MKSNGGGEESGYMPRPCINLSFVNIYSNSETTQKANLEIQQT